MRTELQSLEGKRILLTGIFIRSDWFQTKWGFHKKILLKNVKHSGGMTQHASFSDPSDVRAFEGFGQGEVIQFSAIVHSYVKGYRGENTELRLTHPLCNDYGFHSVQDLRCLSSRSYRKKEVNASLMEELNSRKRISLGIC